MKRELALTGFALLVSILLSSPTFAEPRPVSSVAASQSQIAISAATMEFTSEPYVIEE